MRLVYMRNVARAQIQCCGLWLHVRGTIVGAFPNDLPNQRPHRSAEPEPNYRQFGITVWAHDYYGGVHTVFGIETRKWRLKFRRAFRHVGENGIVTYTVSEGCNTGWDVWRRA